MELTRNPIFLALLHDKAGRVVKEISKHEAMDLAIKAATEYGPRKDGQYTAVYAQVGVSK